MMQFEFKFLVTHTYRLWDLFVPKKGNTDNSEPVFGKNMQIFFDPHSKSDFHMAEAEGGLNEAHIYTDVRL